MTQVDVRSQAVSIARHITAWLARWPSALAVCFLLAVAVLLPRLGSPGLWEPEERQLSDRVAPPTKAGADQPAAAAARPPGPDAPKDACQRAAPPDATARTLTERAIRWGRDNVGDSDGGRRFPLAVLGLITVLAAAGTAMRLAGARAGVITAVVLLAMPLLTLQSRMLTSEIGTACGASLIVYGLVALGQLRRRWAVPDALSAIAGLAGGLVLGFLGGGALLGVLVPIGAVAAAGSFGLPIVAAIRRREPIAPWIPFALAALAALGLIGLLAYQLYDLKPPYPGLTPPPARQVLGKAILPSGCYAWALGGIWRPDDDLRVIYDSMFEQIAYGTYPWGLLGPVAMAALLASSDARRKLLGAATLAWAASAWIASEVFQRKVGFTVYAGFPALAIAVGAWVDDVLARRTRGDADAMPSGAKLIAVFAVFGIVDLGKDMQSFAQRLTSLLVEHDAIAYPTKSTLVFLPTKAWILILGAVVAISFALSLGAWRAGDAPRSRRYQRLATRSAIAALVATLVLAGFWSAIWQPRLADHLSSKGMFETYEALAKPADELVIMGDLGQAPVAYTSRPPQLVPDRTQIITALARPGRVFAIAPQAELCTLHREVSGKPYFVIDDRNQRNVLLSNRLDGAVDRNPLRTAILHDEPRGIAQRANGTVVWDRRIQLLGWDIPKRVARGSRFEVTLYYKILQPVGGSWKSLMHLDGPAGRAGNGDHDPIAGRCPTSTWQLGDYIVDRFTLIAGNRAFPGGSHEVWIGFFTGSAPNWRNMPVSEAPGDMRDNADRVKITTIGLD